MLERVKVSKSSERFLNSEVKTFNFKNGLNLIIGPNSSGKSSLLSIAKHYFKINTLTNTQKLDDSIERPLSIKYKAKGIFNRCYVYAPESLRESQSTLFTRNIRLLVGSKFQSHGEGKVAYHSDFVNKLNNIAFNDTELEYLKSNNIEHDSFITILSDEFENGMSIDYQFELLEWFYSWSKASDNLQIVLATHSIAAFNLIKKQKDINVICLNKEWLKNIFSYL